MPRLTANGDAAHSARSVVAPMKFILVLAILLTASDGVACELSLVAPAMSALKNPVKANVSVANSVLTGRFSVSAPSLNAKKSLGPKEYPYDFDVVELFVTFSDTGFPYYEFEVSPYNQTFQVRIVSAKEHHEGVDLGLMSTAAIISGGWNAELIIPLRPLGWDGDPATIRGNLYSILGAKPKRSYWSTFLPRAKNPDFLQPQYFKPLLQCS
jgi:hypothetical protein